MADTPQVTFERMKSMHALNVRHRAGIKKAYEAARKDLRAGIDHESEEEIKLALPALGAAVGDRRHRAQGSRRDRRRARCAEEPGPHTEGRNHRLQDGLPEAREGGPRGNRPRMTARPRRRPAWRCST